jgi:hypothetical protein
MGPGPSREEITVTTKPRAYALDWRTPTSFGVFGGSAADRARLAWAFARRVDQSPYWIQLVEARHGPETPPVLAAGWVPAHHLVVLAPSDLAPRPELGSIADWLAREDIEADRRVRTVLDFVRLPNLLREIAEDHGGDAATKALVIADSHRAAPFYVDEPQGIRPFVEALNEYSTTIVFAAGESETRYAADVDYVFRLDRDTSGPPVTAECVGGAPRGPEGLFHVGERRELLTLLKELGRT